MQPDIKPTIVLVHGAFADASGWRGVIERLTGQGFAVLAPPNPLRGVITDGDSVRTFLSTIEGPVVLVGHSYGGSVITNASVGAPNVKALVFISAYAPDEGESLGAAGALELAGNAWEMSVARKQLAEIRRLMLAGTQRPAWTKRLGAPAVALLALMAVLFTVVP